MAKVKLAMNRAYFNCPGCKSAHAFRIKAPPNDPGAEVWTFNGDVDRPTFSPSLLLIDTTKPCHLYVSEGKIHFLHDCWHELAGKIVEMEDV